MKKKDTPEARRFWELAEKTAEEVKQWPEWKRGGCNYLSDYLEEPPSRFALLMRNTKNKD